VLIRMTHAADLPTPDELIKKIQDGQNPSGFASSNNGGGPAQSGQGRSQISSTSGNLTTNAVAGSTPSLVSSTSGTNAALAMGEAKPQIDTPKRTLNRFEDLIFLVEDKRDLPMKTYLRRNVRVVSFSDGRMEVNLVKNPPKTFLTDLSKKLQAWTGTRWMISTSTQEGAPTLDEVDQAETMAVEEQARTDPIVESILSRFPGSRIIDVRIRQEDTLEDGEIEGSQDGEDDGLDEFFE